MNTPRTDQTKRKARDGYESDVVVDARICAEIETHLEDCRQLLQSLDDRGGLGLTIHREIAECVKRTAPQKISG